MPVRATQYTHSQLAMENVPLARIADAFGTPVYVYSKNTILDRLAALQSAFATVNPTFHFSLKSNGNGHLVRLLVEAGCGCDAVSANEVLLGLRAGCPPERIVFAGVGKTKAEIRTVLAESIGWINVENSAELERIDRIACDMNVRPRLALRINPAVQADTHKHIATGHEGAKFGIPVDEARELLMRRKTYRCVDIDGLHLHIGSQLGRPDESAAAANIAMNLAHEFGLHHLNMGGGFPVSYDGAPTALPADFAKALLPVFQNSGVTVSFEPGRYLIAEAGLLLAEVQYLKRNGQTVVLDTGMTELLRPALYQARHPILPLVQSDQPRKTVQVVGPICESTDVLHTAAELPPLVEGDRVALGMAGAYGMSMASNYNGRLRPAEVLVDGDSWRLIRRRETLEDLVAQEVVE